MAYLLKNTISLFASRQLLQAAQGNCLKGIYCPLSTSTFSFWQKQQSRAAAAAAAGPEGETKPNAAKKSNPTSLKITLIHNDNISVTGLDEARNLAKRRSMHLVQVQKMDAKTQRPVYKLLTAAERLQSELSDLNSSSDKSSDKTQQKKTEKNLNIGSRISDNDLASRLKNITKWLNKRHEVRILIQGTEKDLASCEKVFKAIEESVKTPIVIGKVVQKRVKGAVIKFNILPVLPADEQKTSTSSPPSPSQ